MSSTVLFASSFIAKISTSIFTGSAIYINLVEHPARLQCGTKTAITQWAPSYKRAALMQASLASIGMLSSFTSYYLTTDLKWLTAGLFIFSVIPFTFAFIMPTNKKLLDTKRDKESDETKSLLEKWGRLHAVRSIAGLIALILMNLS